MCRRQRAHGTFKVYAIFRLETRSETPGFAEAQLRRGQFFAIVERALLRAKVRSSTSRMLLRRYWALRIRLRPARFASYSAASAR